MYKNDKANYKGKPAAVSRRWQPKNTMTDLQTVPSLVAIKTIKTLICPFCTKTFLYCHKRGWVSSFKSIDGYFI